MVICRVEIYMAILRVLHWDSSHLVQNLDLRQVLPLESHMGMLVLL